MQWDWPVVVNFHEASAFAAWKAKETGKAIRVITELEHRAIRDETNSKTFVDTDDAVVKYSGHEMISKVFL